MSAARDDEDRTEHRFFHTMVVMGGALALGCGGISAGDTPSKPAGSGGAGGSGGRDGTSGAPGGNTSAGGTGGSAVITIPDAGPPGPIEPGPFVCSPSEWQCSTGGSACHRDGYELPESCPCDATRPASADECADGELFVCRQATANHEGVAFTRTVPFDCHCVSEEPTCEAACDKTYGARGSCYVDGTDARAVLCGCAVIVLR